MVAVAGHDAVVAADVGRVTGALDPGQHSASGIERDGAVVAQDHAVAGAGLDAVRARAAGDELVAVGADDGVIGAAGVGVDRRIDERRQPARVERDGAVVAQQHVAAGAGHDAVGAHAAKDDVVAVAGHDGVVAAGVGQCASALDTAQYRPGRVQRDGAVVAQDDIVAVAGLDTVGARAADDDLVAVGADDGVVAAAGVGVDRGVDERRPPVRVERDGAVVAQQHVAAIAGPDTVVARAADHDMVAIAQRDAVVTGHAGQRCHPRDGQHLQAVGAARDAAIVAQDQHRAVARADDIVADAADHQFAAVAGHDGVVAAAGRLRAAAGEGDGHAGRIEADAAVVAEDDVVAIGGTDGVAADAAEHDRRRAAGSDGVGAADGRRAVLRGDAGQVLRQRVELQRAVVADDDVAAAGHRDAVGAVAADDDVIARHVGDAVVAAGRVRGTGHPHHAGVAQQVVGAGQLDDVAMVADQDVVAGAAVEHVVADRQRVRHAGHVARRGRVHHRHQVRAGHGEALRQVDIDPGVAVHMVGARTGGNGVVARTARQHIVERAAVDRVVAGAAVNRHAAAGVARIDGVVAGVRERQAVAGMVVRRRVVILAVLAGVAEQHQRRVGAAAAGDDESVVAAAALHHRQGILDGAADGELVVALSEQQVDHFHAVEGDAAVEPAQVRPCRTAHVQRQRAAHAQAGEVAVAGQVDRACRQAAQHGYARGRGGVSQHALVIGQAAVVVHHQRVGVALFLPQRTGGRQDAVGFKRQHDRFLQAAVEVAGDAAFDEQRPGDGAERVRLVGELLHGGRSRRDGAGADAHLERHVPVGRREGHARHAVHQRVAIVAGRVVDIVGQHGAAACQQRHRDRRARCLRQAERVEGIAAGRHGAAQGRHQQGAGVVVAHVDLHFLVRHRAIRAAAAAVGAGDVHGHGAGLAVFHDLVVDRVEAHGECLVPVGGVERDGAAGQVQARGLGRIAGRNGQLGVVVVELDGHRLARLRSLREHQAVAGAGAAFGDLAGAGGLGDDQARFVVVDDAHLHA